MSGPAPLRQRFSRRSLLRGLGAGAATLAPVLRARVASAQAGPPPPPAPPAGNLLIFYTPNGHRRSLTVNGQDTLAFDAASVAGGGMVLGSSLSPLQPFQRDVAVIRGLNLKTPTFIASHQDIARILTCVGNPAGEKNDQSQFSAFGPSIDHVVATSFGQKPLVVAVDPYRATPHWRTFLSWSAAEVNEPFVKDHAAVFTDLFGGLSRARTRSASILDFARNNLAAFRPRVNTADRPNVDAYSDALQSLQQKVVLGPTLSPSCAPNLLAARVAALPATAPVQTDDKSPGGVVAEMRTRGELWMDMIATAFACGTRRVAVIQWQGASEGYNPADDMGSPNHHSVTMNAAPVEHWAAIDTWYAGRFAYQLNALAKLGVLDRTIVVWVSEITEAHNQLDMVTVVAGGQSLGLKTGQYIRYPFTGSQSETGNPILVAQDPANRSLADLWVTVQQALGVDKPTFGDPKFCAGPLTELRG